MTTNELTSMLRLNKESAFNWRRRRHNDWTENYTLYRDKVVINRLTQRQSVNIPLLKYSIKTLLKDIDDPPIMYFSNLDNNEQAEVYYNEYWKYCARENKNTIKDIVDKRQVLLFGRSFKKLNMQHGRFYWEVIDPQDILIDRFVDPSNIDTARFICHEHLYKPLSSLRVNPMYDIQAVKRLQAFYASEDGLIKATQNQLDFIEKQKRMAEMGVIDIYNPILGETYIELNEWFIKMWDEQLKEDVLYFVAIADDMEILFMKPLEQLIGKTIDNYWRNHYPLSSWGDETERTDIWNDGVSDTLRTPNKVLNAWFSQEVESRTLANYGMNYYNSSLGEEGFVPQTFTPEPWGWYGVPGNPNETIQHIDIQPLATNMQAMEFLIGVAEKASAATNFQQGVTGQNEITLGEVKLLLQNAQERVRSMAVYYTDSWEEFGLKYIKMLEAAPHLLDEVTIHRHGRLTKRMYTKSLNPDDWKTKLGYKVDVKMKSQQDAEDADALQWLNASRSVMPQNQVVDEAYKRKLLEKANLTQDEIQEALKLDRQNQQAQQQMMGQLPQTQAPVQTINYKDLGGLPNQPQQQMLAEVGIQANGAAPNQTQPAIAQKQLGAGTTQAPMGAAA